MSIQHVKQPASLIIAATLLFSLGACATIFNNGSQTSQVSPITGETLDADRIRVQITTGSGAFETTIPGTVVLVPTLSGSTIRVSEPCYEPTSMELPRSVTASYWANIPGILIYVGLFGFFVDPLTGDMWKYDTNISVPVRRVPDFADCRAKLKKS